MTSAALAEPAFQSCPEWDVTLGPEVSDLCDFAGFAPDENQAAALDVIFAEQADGRPAAFQDTTICTRQQLKTALFKQAALGWLFVVPQRLIVWSAHEFSTAQEAHRDLALLLDSDSTPSALRKRVRRVHWGNGDESIEMVTGQRIVFRARTRTGGRGLSGDRVVLDEGFALRPEHMGALVPTMLARPHGQLIVGSSAGMASSHVLRGIRDLGRMTEGGRESYREWCDVRPLECAEGDCTHRVGAVGCSLDDESRWWAAMPSLGGRVSVEMVRNLRRVLPPEEFIRECLGHWDDPETSRLFDSGAWADGLDPHSHRSGDPVFALDVAPDRSWAAVAMAATRADGLMHVEVTGRRNADGLAELDHREGTSWVVPRLAAMAKATPWFQVRVFAGSPAAALTASLRKRDVDVVEVPAAHIPKACGLFYDQVAAREVRHLGQAALTAAVLGARKRSESTESAFVFGRGPSSSDITPLYAAANALLGAVEPFEGPAIY